MGKMEDVCAKLAGSAWEQSLFPGEPASSVDRRPPDLHLNLCTQLCGEITWGYKYGFNAVRNTREDLLKVKSRRAERSLHKRPAVVKDSQRGHPAHYNFVDAACPFWYNPLFLRRSTLRPEIY